jgi:hypothetical protein
MAYPTVAGPYGFQPINLIGGQVFAGATRQIPIASGSGTSIFYGDVVRLNTGGTLSRAATGTTSATDAVGVFLGCSYTNPSTNQKVYAQYYPASTVASDIVAYVQDDPDQLYKVAVLSTSTAVSGLTRAAVGQNVAFFLTAGSTTSGDSKEGVYNSTGSTTTLPFRIVDVVPETVNASGSYTEVIVKFNFGVHTYYSATNVATAA